MTEVWFYHLQRQPLEKALPAIVEKSLARGWRVVLQAKSEERLDMLDDLLWTYSDSSFIGHGRARDGDAELQPVFLTTGAENPNGAKLRLFVEGAEMLLDEGAYERAILLFDGLDEEQLTDARRQWKLLRDKGFALAYWQQTERGGWEKKL